jgi:hypothetical protein
MSGQQDYSTSRLGILDLPSGIVRLEKLMGWFSINRVAQIADTFYSCFYQVTWM